MLSGLSLFPGKKREVDPPQLLPKKPKDGPMVISEPACGSGSLIIATTEKLKKLGYGKRDFYFIANDIDDRCVKMAFIQCTLLDIPVDFYTGDTLTQKYNYRRPTLTYILNHMGMADKI